VTPAQNFISAIPYSILPFRALPIQGWQKLRDWIQAEDENLMLQRQLTPAAVSWQQEQQRIRFLWHNNPRLSLLQQKDTAWLNQLERTFMQRSIRQRRLNNLRNVGILAIVGLLSVGGIAFSRNSQINRMLDLQGSAEERLLRNQNLEALIESIKAAKALKQPLLRMFPPTENRRNEVQETLQNAVYQIRERNRLIADQPIGTIAFSPNGQLIAVVQKSPSQNSAIVQENSNQSNTNQSSTVSFWDRSGKPLSNFNTPDVGGSIMAISFTTDSEHIIVEVLDQTSNQTVAKRWNLRGDLQIQEAQDIYSLGFNLTERMLPPDPLYIAYNSDATLSATAEISSGNIAVYRINSSNGQPQEQIASINDTLSFNSNLSLTIRFSPDSQRIVAASGGDERIYLWDVRGNQLAQFNYQGGVLDLKFSPDGQQLAIVGRDGAVRIWQHLEGSQYQEYKGYSEQNWIQSIQLNSENASQVAVGMNSGRVQMWNLNTLQGTELPTPVPSVDGLRFSPDGRLLAVGTEAGQTYLWNLETQQISPAMQGPQVRSGTLQRDLLGSSLWGGAFSPDGQQLILGGDDTIIYNALQPEQQIFLPKDGSDQGTLSAGWLHAFSFDSSWQLLAAGGLDEQLRLWNWKNLAESGNVQSWSQVQISQNQKVIPTRMPVRDVVFSPQGNLVAVAGIDDGMAIVRLLNLEGQQQAELRGHEGIINAVLFSPDGSWLATASEDGTARLWNLHGQQFAVFEGHDEVKHIAFRNNAELVTAGVSNRTPDGTVTSWQVKTWKIENLEQLLERGCTWIQGYLQNSSDLENKLEFKDDRTLCQGISSASSAQIDPAQIYYLIPVELSQGSIAQRFSKGNEALGFGGFATSSRARTLR
jgi:WD40 repeat protein